MWKELTQRCSCSDMTTHVLLLLPALKVLRICGMMLFFIPSKYREGYIHSGFNRIFKLINKPLCYSVKNLFRGDPVNEIIAGGHSLGASISMGTCDCIGDNFDARTHITTWGCPNGWSKGARKSFNERHPDVTNYINPGDYVTWMLGITTGRPGRDIKLSGKWGHMMDKYMRNVKAVKNH